MPEDGHARSLRLRYGAGYADDLDERILLPFEGTVVGRAWTTGSECFEAAPFDEALALPGRINRYRKQQVWRDMEWVLCVPIYAQDAPEDGLPEFVVSIDCNERPTIGAVPPFLEVVSSLVVDSFEELLVQLEEIGAGS